MRLAPLVGAVALAACAEPVCGDGEAVLVLGLGSADRAPFADVAEGGDAALHIGSQGGFHVWLQARAGGVCPDEARLRFEVAAGGEVVASGVAPMVLAASTELGAGWYDAERATAAIVCPAPPSIDLVDGEVTITAEIEDAAGRIARDERRVVLRCPDDDAAVTATCNRICDRQL